MTKYHQGWKESKKFKAESRLESIIAVEAFVVTCYVWFMLMLIYMLGGVN